ncbi:MAG: protein kinase [Pirellulaceae bacterium]
MNDHRYSITVDATSDVEQLLTQFERDRATGPVDLRRYVPHRDDPAYKSVVTELSRIDLEHLFNEGKLPNANLYIHDFPDVFNDAHYRGQLVFEELRLRRRGGDAVPADDLGRKYQVDASHWPPLMVVNEREPMPRISRRFHRDELSRPVISYPTIDQSFAGYPLVGRIGEGRFSRVLLARQPDLASRLVVLKLTPMLTDESDRLASLQHSSIIPIYSVHREGELSGICMPYLGRTTLADLSRHCRRWASMDGPAEELVTTILDQRASTITPSERTSWKTNIDQGASLSAPPSCPDGASSSDGSKILSPELIELSRSDYVQGFVQLITGAVEGLAYAHARGIIHRDLKPANILITDDGRPVLLDFNLATSRDEPTTQVVGGTLPYMSPQQLEALETRAPADARDDVFSMGVILYELLSGRMPFASPADEMGFDLATVVNDRRVVPASIRKDNPRVSPGLESIIQRCLAAERVDRYENADQLLQDLNLHRQHRPLRYAPERSVRERLAKWRRRHPRVASAGSVALISAIIVLFGTLAIWRRGERIAGLEVESRYDTFLRQSPLAVSSLSAPGREPEILLMGVGQAKALLESWHAEDKDWETQSQLHRLDDRSRSHLRRQLGRTAYLVADALHHLSRQSTSATAERYAADARYWNQRISSFDADFVDLARLQRDRLEASSKSRVAPAMSPPTDAAPIDVQALWAKEIGNNELWLRLTERFLDDQPTNPGLWTELAIAKSQLGDPRGALNGFDMAVRLQPASVATLLNRGLCHLDLDNPEAAFQDFDRCLKISNDLIAPRFNRAVAAYRLRRFSEARDDLNVLIRNRQQRPRVYLMRAKVHDALNDSQAAERDRSTARKLDPQDANDLIALGISLLSEFPEEALEKFQAAADREPNNVAALTNLAHVCSERLGRHDEAIGWLNRLLSVSPELPSALASRGILHARSGRIEKAVHDAHHAAQRQPDGLVNQLKASLRCPVRTAMMTNIATGLLLAGGHPETQPVARSRCGNRPGSFSFGTRRSVQSIDRGRITEALQRGL